MSSPSERNAELQKRKLLLAKLKKASSAKKQTKPRQMIPLADRSQPLPLSWSQQRLWFLLQLDPESSSAYHMRQALRLNGDLRVDCLQQALNALLQRHEILRTVYHEQIGVPYQVIQPAATFALQQFDLSAFDAETIDLEIERHSDLETELPFDLANGPVARGRLLKLPDQGYVLLITTHHIATDGWSEKIFSTELSELYAAFSQGEPNSLSELSIQYADFASWQRSQLSQEKIQQQLVFWQQELQGLPPLLDVPTDFPRPAIQHYTGKHLDVSFPQDMAQAIHQFCRTQNVTLHMLLMSAWSVTLAKMSGQTDLAVGTPVANRGHTQLESLIGYFVNTLAIRMTLSEQDTALTVLDQFRRRTLSAYDHQDAPFEQVVDALSLERSLSHSPVYQSLFVLDNTEERANDADDDDADDDLHVAGQDLNATTTQFDMVLNIEHDEDQIDASLIYASHLFQESTVQRWAAYYQNVVRMMVNQPSLPLLASIDLIDQDHAQLQSLNHTEQAYRTDVTIHQLIEEQAKRTPEAAALISDGQSLTYQTLSNRADQLAAELRQQGAGPDQVVAIAAERSINLVVAMLATLKAGAAYLPLDTAFPSTRLASMLDIAQPCLVLAQDSLVECVPQSTDIPVLSLEQTLNSAIENDERVERVELSDRHLAYVIFTSGSTGEPKGVMTEHRALVNRLNWMQDAFPLTNDDRILQKTPYSFDVSVWEFFWPLMTGATLVMARPEGHKDPTYLQSVIESTQVTVCHFVPSMLNLFLQQWQPNNRHALRHVFCSGEALAGESVTQFQAKFPTTKLHNLYGPTEAAIDVTYWSCDDDQSIASPPIGRPIANTQIHILDAGGQPVPLGVTGEIFIAGAGLARGYLNRDALTQERFVEKNVFGETVRCYKTGDLGRWNTQGQIEYLGRNDFQIKIRGLRIELGDIEMALRTMTNIKDVLVTLHTTEGNQQHLVAYVIAPTDADTVEWTTLLSQQLPEYMVPALFVCLDEWPLNNSGKVDRKQLPAPMVSQHDALFEAPESATERYLQSLWGDLLTISDGAERIGRNDHFFQLGGHSLLAAQMLGHIRQDLNKDISIRDLFNTPKLGELANRIDQADSTAIQEIERVERHQAYPASWSQQRLWFLSHLDRAASSAYNVTGTLTLQHVFDESALRQTLQTLVDRHESLRTQFFWQDGKPFQQVQTTVDPIFEIVDCRSLRENALADEIDHWERFEDQEAFDLEAPTLFRTRVLRIRDDEFQLLLTFHHIIADGWSMEVLSREFEPLYVAALQSGEMSLPTLPLQYLDYAAWQHQRITGGQLSNALNYWREQLSGLPTLHNLPTDFPRPKEQSYVGSSTTFYLDRATSEQLNSLAQSCQATPFMVFHAALTSLMHRYSQQSDIVIGTPVANRDHQAFESVIGFFVNTLVLRSELDGQQSFIELLTQSREQCLNAFAHQDAPFDWLVEELNPPRSLSYNPLFQVMLSMANHQMDDVHNSTDALSESIGTAGGQTAQFDLTLDVMPEAGQYRLTWSFADDLFQAKTIEQMAKHFIALLSEALQQPHKAMAESSLLSSTERQNLITQGTGKVEPSFLNDSWNALFRRQALQTPDCVAVACHNQQLSYSTLLKRSEKLAHRLIGRGVKPGDRIAVLMHRDCDLMTAMAGTLLAGAVYVPLDPTHPPQRWRGILTEAKPALCLVGEHVDDIPSDVTTPLVTFTELAQSSDSEASVELPTPALTDLAYVIYTSGSTGRPKGVMIEHRGMINNMLSKVEPLGLSEDDVIAQTASQCFDISVWQFLTAPLLGAKVCILDNDTVRDPSALLTALTEQGVTVWEPVPSVMQAALLTSQPLPSLRWVLPTGEALSKDLVQRWFETYPNIPLMNAYGPAECSDDVAFEPIHGPVERVLIGRPVANARLHVVDAHRQLVPVGVVGELAISGPVVGRGYLNRDDLTAEVFIDNPFAQDDLDQRLYLTGDLVRRLDDGRLEYVGRKDFQVKIRGFRIELGEIESSLCEHDDVREALVVAHTNEQGEASLVAYAVTDSAATDLKTHLKARLPAYMVPSFILPLSAFPLTANGKIDRTKLPEPDASALSQTIFEAPEDETEQLLADIWQDLLGIERVGRFDNFFDLGGHSLMIMLLIKQLQQRGAAIAARDVFDTDSLAELAQRVDFQPTATFDIPENRIPTPCTHITPDMVTLADLTQPQLNQLAEAVPGGMANIQDTYPLAPLQEGILFHHLMVEDGDTYVTPILIELDSRAHVDAFLNAFQQVVNRHDILRTAIVWENLPAAMQVVLRDVEVPISEFRLLPNQPVGDQLSARMDVSNLQMALDDGPLMRIEIASDPQGDAWYLILKEHHLISDHVSLDLELAEIQAFLEGEGDALPPVAQYRDFVAHTLAQQVEQKAQTYFQNQFSDLDEPTLPFGLIDVYGDGRFVEKGTQALPAALNQRIRQLSQQHQMSPASLFHLAWAWVIARSANRDDVVFGTVLSGRLQGLRGVDRMLGMFINLLPYRLTLKDGSAMSMWQAAHRQLIDLIPLEQASLALAQRASGVQGEAPLFSAILNYRHDSEDKDINESTWDGIELLSADELTNYPLELSVDVMADGFALEVFVDRSIGAQRVLGYVEQALEQLVEALEQDASTPVLSLPLLSDAEQDQQLQQYSGASRIYPGAVTVHERFAAIAEQMPEAIAAVHNGERLSYGALKARVNQVAHRLVARGVGPNTLVALHCPRGLDFLVGVLGTLSAGGAYVPLDPNNPADRLSYMVEHAQASVVLTHTSLAGQLDYPQDSIALALDDASLWADQPVEHPDVVVGGDDLAYMIFTSGSTGRPKGALVHHAGALNHIDAEFELLDASDAQGLQPLTFLQSAASSSDVSVWQFLAPVVSGGTTVILDDQSDVPNLVRTLQQERVQLIQTAPVVLQVLVDYLEQQAEQGGEFALPDLRWLMTIAEACPVPLINRWFALNPEIPIMNGFGPSEASDDITYHILREPLSADTLSVPIGRPIANLTMYVVDEQLQLQPHGVVGELCVSGVGVGPGYWQDEARTNAVFVANPYAGQPGVHGERLYRTGDLGRWLPDGTLEFLGRKDNQVKIRGFRVELGEVEAALAKVDGTADVAVLVQPGPTGDARLAAYVVPSDGVTLTAEQIRTALQAHLPEYMLPSSVTFLERMPLNAADKIDRAKLPAPDWSQSQVAYRAPEGELEQTLAEIWRDVLGVEQVGRDDHFFLLGGHSLLIMRVLEQARQAGYQIAARTVFDAPTLSEQATKLTPLTQDAQWQAPANRIPESCEQITPEMLPLISLAQTEIDQIATQIPGGMTNIQDIYPLAPLQKGLLFHHLYSEGSDQGDTYITSKILSFDDRDEIDTCLIALQQILDRHDIQRTAIIWDGLDEAVQVVQREAILPVEWLSVSDGEDAFERLQQETESAALTMTLSSAPLKSVTIAEDRANQRWLLLLKEHHLISDHVSMELEMEEIEAIMVGDSEELTMPIPYREFVAHVAEQTREFDPTHYFSSLLTGYEEPACPYGLTDIYDTGIHAHELNVPLSDSLSQRIRQASQALGVSAAALFHLAWSHVVATCSGRNDVVIGTVLSGRMQNGVGLDRMLGMFINMLPVRVQLAQGQASEQLQQLHNQLLDLIKYEQTSLSTAQACSDLTGGTPLFSATINYRHTEADVDDEAEDDGVEVLMNQEFTNYPFHLAVDDQAAGFNLEVHVDQSVPAEDVAALMTQSLEACVNALEVASPVPVDQLPIVPAHLASVLEAAPSANELTHWLDRFGTTVTKHTDEIALTAESGEWTYKELDTCSTQLANYLQEQGIKPQSVVALVLPRSPELIFAWLALWKLNAVYVPVDPNLPRERIQTMVQGAGIQFALTTTKWHSELGELPELLQTWDIQSALLAANEVSTATLSVTRKPEDLAYCLFTSGSTGTPKGVEVSHGNLAHYVDHALNSYYDASLEGALLLSSFNFDGSLPNVFLPLVTGGQLVLVGDDHAYEEAVMALRESDAGFVKLTPSQMQLLLGEVHEPIEGRHVLVLGGEIFSASLREALQEAFPNARIYNHYGPTETTVGCTLYDATDDHNDVIPLGVPNPRTPMRIVDANQNPVPRGVVGELWIGGAGVAVGYRNLPDLTDQAFVANHSESGIAERWYRTGDLVRLNTHEYLEFEGRKDFQVKIRGLRIELGEVETALQSLASVTHAAVIVWTGANQQQRLVAYVVLNESISSDGIQAQLKHQLPDYAIPSAIIVLDQLPLNDSGKVLRRALPEPNELDLPNTDYQPAQTQTEQSLVDIWMELLALDRIGRYDDFFNLGGQSLLATQMLSRLRRQFDIDLTLLTIFENPVLKDLAAAIDTRLLEQVESDTVDELMAELDDLSEDEMRRLLEMDD